jgi:hypothetical protein
VINSIDVLWKAIITAAAATAPFTIITIMLWNMVSYIVIVRIAIVGTAAVAVYIHIVITLLCDGAAHAQRPAS